MKLTLMLIVFWFSVLTLTAQNNLLCSGTVTNSLNGSPIANQVVIIHNDSAAGTSGYFYRTVLTNATGVYYDTILLQPVNNQGTVHIGTVDCQNYLNVYSASYGQNSYSVQHDFSICYSGATCNADFYSIQDSNAVNTFTFVPTYTANVTTWLWDFGDGTSASVTFPQSPNVTHSFAGSAISHTVCLTIQSSNSCTDTKCHTITWQNQGSCVADYYYVYPYVTEPVQFYDWSQSSGGTITSWSWDFGDPASGINNTSTSQNPVHTYPAPGYYNVCLTIQGTNNCNDVKCQVVQVHSYCYAEFTYEDSVNTVNPVHFIDLSGSIQGPIVSWYWNFGDPASGTNNFSSLQNPDHIFTAPGTYSVCLTAHGSDSLCYDTWCREIVIGGSSGCIAAFTYTNPPNAPSFVQFEDLSTTASGSIISWSWDFGDGTTSSLQNPVHTYTTGGSYTVCLTIYGDSCQNTHCTTVQVGSTPGCMSYFTHTTTYLSVNFQGFITNGNYLQGGTFTWDFGDGAGPAFGQTVTHVYPGTGNFSVTLTAVDSSGCSSTYIETISLYDSINTHQVYGQVFAGNFPLTSGLAMIFSLDSTANYSPYVNVAAIDSAGTYYFTMVPDGNYYIFAIPILPAGYLPTYYGNTLDWQNATIVNLGQAANPYNINLLVAYNSSGGSGTINGQVNMGQVKSTFLDKVTMLLMNDQLQPINFFKVNSTGDFTFPTLSYGTYYLKAEIPGVTSDVVMVVISDANPVANVTMTFSGNKILGIDETNQSLSAGILYPNPVSDVVNLSLKTNQATTVQVDIFNMEGQAVVHSEKSLGTGESVITIPVSGLAKGIYTFRVHSDQGINIIRKLVK